jgi:hypothetical protein
MTDAAEAELHNEVRRVIGVPLPDEDVAALAAVYASLSRNVASFPAHDLQAVEPPLRSIPGPTP